MARVNVNITARDLTGNDLRRIRTSFNRLGQDMDRLGTRRTRENFNRLSSSVSGARRQLDALRGSIPDDEFFRLDNAMRQAQRRLQRGFGRTTQNQIARIRRDIDRVTDGFRDLDRNGQIRIRVDDSALRRADARLRAGLRDRTVRVRVRDDTSSGFRAIRRHGDRDSAGLGSRFGSLIGGTMSDGIGQGLANAFRNASSNPYVVAALVAMLAVLASFLGAALSGIIVTALGGAFVSVGVIAAAQSKKVKDEWGRTSKVLKKIFTESGEPFIDVLDQALERTQRIAKTFAPAFQDAMVKAAPATDEFIQSLQDGFVRFGQNAFKPLMDAWNVFGPVFGQEFEDFMGELGDSFKEMANVVKEHPEEIRIALRGVFETIDLLVDAVTFLGQTWVFALQNAGDAIGFLIKYGLRYLVDAVLFVAETITEKFAEAFGWVPGIGPKLKAAAKSVEGFRDDAWDSLTAVAEAAFGMDDALNRANKKRKLEADISAWQSQLKTARADLKKTSDQKAKAKLKADISDLNAKIADAKAKLEALNGKTAMTYVVTNYTQQRNYGYNGNSATGGHAHGGIIGAATGGIRSRMTMVGEHGPELVDLPSGSRVRSNPDTRRMLAGAGGGGGAPMQVNLVVDGRRLASVMVDPLRGEIRDRGGNVQNALGQRGK